MKFPVAQTHFVPRLRWLLSWFLCLITLVGHSATQLGQHTFVNASTLVDLDAAYRARPVGRARTLEASLGSWGFLNSVGGVAFGHVAETNQDYRIEALHYDSAQSDGQRLRVELRDRFGRRRTTTAPIADWQLAPIAKFANSDVFSCVTIFGELQDKQEEQKYRSQGARIVNYHSAFRDRLLGLRLLQGDILILSTDAAGLMQVDGEVPLGQGEQAADLRANQGRYRRIWNSERSEFQSYVVCDFDQRIEWSIKGRDLELQGEPYWYCWRTKPSVKSRFQQLQNEANREANRRVQSEGKSFSREEATRRHFSYFDEYLSREAIEAMPEYSRSLTERIRQADGVNPEVYRALRNTMRYAALFRLVKREQPAAWSAFLREVQNIPVQPAVTTPAVMFEPGPRRPRIEGLE
jgi:hypothetical protein